MFQPQIRLRKFVHRFRPRTSRRQTARKAPTSTAGLLLARFRTRHEVLLARYERLVARCDSLDARRGLVTRQIRSLEKAIAALERYSRTT